MNTYDLSGIKIVKEKGEYWKDVWDKLVKILGDAGVTLPNDDVSSNLPERTREEKERKEADETKKILDMAKKNLGNFSIRAKNCFNGADSIL